MRNKIINIVKSAFIGVLTLTAILGILLSIVGLIHSLS